MINNNKREMFVSQPGRASEILVKKRAKSCRYQVLLLLKTGAEALPVVSQGRE